MRTLRMAVHQVPSDDNQLLSCSLLCLVVPFLYSFADEVLFKSCLYATTAYKHSIRRFLRCFDGFIHLETLLQLINCLRSERGQHIQVHQNRQHLSEWILKDHCLFRIIYKGFGSEWNQIFSQLSLVPLNYGQMSSMEIYWKRFPFKCSKLSSCEALSQDSKPCPMAHLSMGHTLICHGVQFKVSRTVTTESNFAVSCHCSEISHVEIH